MSGHTFEAMYKRSYLIALSSYGGTYPHNTLQDGGVIYNPTLPFLLLLGSPMLMDPHPGQQHAGLQHAVFQLHQQVAPGP